MLYRKDKKQNHCISQIIIIISLLYVYFNPPEDWVNRSPLIYLLPLNPHLSFPS